MRICQELLLIKKKVQLFVVVYIFMLVCGAILVLNNIHEGEWVRSFENAGGGKDDNSQHGRAPDPFMSSSYNLRTSIQANTKQEKSFCILMKQIDMGSNQVLKKLNIQDGDRRTREGYKDKQKEEARTFLCNLRDRLSLPKNIVNIALSTFSAYRDIKEKIQDLDIVLGGCIIIISFFYNHKYRKINIISFK